MKKLKVYLDTSIINFLFAEDAPEFKSITESFFNDYVIKNIYDIAISEVVIEEINNTTHPGKKKQLGGILEKYKFKIILLNEEVELLADCYLKEGVIPIRKVEDARHIAIATVNNFDVLLSWNFKHLANINKKYKVKTINEREGYHYPLDLLTPIQLIYDENDN